MVNTFVEFMSIFFDNLVFMTIESNCDYTKYSHIGWSSYNLNLPNLISLKIHFPSTPFGSWKWSRTLNIFIYLVFHSLNNMLSFFFSQLTLVTILLIPTCLRGHCLWWRWKRIVIHLILMLSLNQSREWPPLHTSTEHN